MILIDKKIAAKNIIESEFSNLTLKNIDEKDFNDHDVEEIKSFFAKE